MSGGAALAEPPVPSPDTNNSFTINSTWLLLNLNVTGYFRVNYNQENWDQLLNQLGTDQTVHGAFWAVVWDTIHTTPLRLP